MKNKKISIKTIIIIVLIGIIIALISIILNMKNINIKEQIVSKEQLTEATENNSYVDVQTHMTEVNEQEKKLLEFKSAIATAITSEGVTTSSSDTETTMASNITKILKTRTSNATATASDIIQGKTAWVNGELITGTYTEPESSYNVKLIGTKNSMTEGNSFSVDLDNQNIDTEILNTLTSDNFLVSPAQFYVSGASTGYVQTWFDASYNQSSHVVTFSMNGIHASAGNYSASINIKLWVYYPI